MVVLPTTEIIEPGQFAPNLFIIKMTFINGFICDKIKSFYIFLRRLL